jgi:hypothetical protein
MMFIIGSIMLGGCGICIGLQEYKLALSFAIWLGIVLLGFISAPRETRTEDE